MYRHIPLSIALSVAAASPLAWSAEAVTTQPATQVKREASHASRAHLTHVANHRTNANDMSRKHGDVVAMAPAATDSDDWHTRLAAAGPASEVTQDLIRHEDEQERSNKLNVYGMLAAALGLGLMSIIRRMGRF